MWPSKLQRMLHKQPSKKIEFLRIQTTIFEMNFEFSVVIWNSKSSQPTSHFDMKLRQKSIHEKSETTDMYNDFSRDTCVKIEPTNFAF
jgi:hypothetical protein